MRLVIYATFCLSECGTWSHAVIPSLGARARRGGGRAPAFRVACCQTQSGVRFDGLGWVPSGSRMVPNRSVYQSYTDTGQSSDLAGLVGSLRAISGSDGFPSEPCFGTTGPDMARRIARLSRIGARLMYGPPGHAMAAPRALRRPVGTQRTPGGTVGPRLIGASPVWAARHSYWRPPVYL